MLLPTTIDFETAAIEGRPSYPPEPVGVSIKEPGSEAEYHAWGHPEGNNCSKEDAKRILRRIFSSGAPLLFYNAKFDVEVAVERMGCPMPPWHLIHDAMFLAFLNDPHAIELSLKPVAEKVLGIPPEERDLLKEWVVANVPEARRKPSSWGAYICRAPAGLVGEYANGDVLRTEKLFQALYTKINQDGMLAAYNRERRLMPILLRNEQEGIRIAMEKLEKDIAAYSSSMNAAEEWARKKLGASEINLDSNEELADALESKGLAAGFLLTATGKRSVSKESLASAIKDTQLARVLGYRSRLAVCLNTFMIPWMKIGEKSGGLIHPSWHQIRQAGGSSTKGARTGRLIASNPNPLNLSKSFEGRNDGYEHPSFLEVLPLPLVRTYWLPDNNHVWGHRDYSQQELRILAHYEDGLLCKQYSDNPRLDVHDFVKHEIERLTGRVTERRETKILNFGMIYGMGLGALATDLKVDVEAARKLKAAQRKALPGLEELEKVIKRRGRAGEAIRTWGGRLCFSESPKLINGEIRTFEYKLLNYLIQGSAADCTKEALIRYDEAKKEGRFLVTVYDEINISAPKKSMKKEMEILRDVMASVEFDVPMLSDGKVGPNWGELSKYDI